LFVLQNLRWALLHGIHYSHVYMGWEVSQDFTSLTSVVENQNETHAWKVFHKVMELKRFSVQRQSSEGRSWLWLLIYFVRISVSIYKKK
jgi:hypothetical protein